MRDPAAEPYTSHEARLATRMRRWSDRGVVPIEAAEIARSVVTAPGTARAQRTRSRPHIGAGRMLMGLAACLLLGAALAILGTTTLRRSAPVDAYVAVVTRPVDDSVDAILVAADGRERVLRHLTPASVGLDPRYTLSGTGSVSQTGWLELSAWTDVDELRSGAWWGRTVLVDLADPGRAPIIVASNGFMNGRWGPDGLWANYCHGRPRSEMYPQEVRDAAGPPGCGLPDDAEQGSGGGAVQVIDPDLGAASEVIVPHVQTFGGGPEFVWAADGSGFLAQRGTEWGVTPLDGGPFVPGVPRVFSRLWGTTPLGADTPTGLSAWDDMGVWADVSYRGRLIEERLVGSQLSVDGAALWRLFDDVASTAPQAVLAMVTGPGEVASVQAIDVPVRPVQWFELSPDDAFAAIFFGNDEPQRFVLAPLTPGDHSGSTPAVIDGSLAGLVPAATADAWPGRQAGAPTDVDRRS